MSSRYENEKYFGTDNINLCRIDNIESIPIMDVIRIDKSNYGRIDLICLSYYQTLDVRSIILDYNQISDIMELNIGDIIKLPDLMSLVNNISKINDLTKNCPGIIMTADNLEHNIKIETPKQNTSKPPVTYDNVTGIITY